MQAISIRDLVKQYDQELVRLGYKKTTLKNYRIFWKQVIGYFDSKQESVFAESTAQRFLDDRYDLSQQLKNGPLTRNEQYVRQMVRYLIHFQQYGETGRPSRVSVWRMRSDEFAELLGAYAEFCLERGYASSTRRRLRSHAVGFFRFLESVGVGRLSPLSAETIVEYLNALPVHSYGSVGLVLTSLRTLLRFLHGNGYHQQDLSEAVPHQQKRTAGSIPSICPGSRCS